MIRESMKVMPKFAQPFLSWLTAKPLEEQLKNRKKLKPYFHIYVSFSVLLIGVSVSSVGYISKSYFFMLLGFILSTSGVKQLQVMICHNCAHDMVFSEKKNNRILGEFISIFLFLKPFSLYKNEHILHHDPKKLLTDDDDTQTFLKYFVGIKANDSVHKMWLKLFYSAFSPFKIINSIYLRVRQVIMFWGISSFCSISLLVLTSLATIIFNCFDVFFFSWLLPVFVGYHISSTFRLAAEHTWPEPDILEKRGVHFITDSTTSVFIGEELKLKDENKVFSNIFRKLFWLAKMLTYHLFVRVFIMVGDTPCHDFHHRRPKSSEWPNYISAREIDLREGCKPFPKNYIDSWGYAHTVTNNFKSFKNTIKHRQDIYSNSISSFN